MSACGDECMCTCERVYESVNMCKQEGVHIWLCVHMSVCA